MSKLMKLILHQSWYIKIEKFINIKYVTYDNK